MTPIDKIDLHEFGVRLRAERERHNMTQAELGELVGLSKGSISKYENGTVEELDLNLLARFTRALEVEADDLVKLTSYGYPKPAYISAAEEAPKYGRQTEDTNELLEMLKNDPDLRMVAKIRGQLTEEGKKDLLKYAEYLKSQRDRGWDD